MSKQSKKKSTGLLPAGRDYAAWLSEIKAKIRNAQIKAAVRVNTELLSLYWELGAMIAEKQSKAHWGDSVMEQLSKDLMAEFPEMKGFSKRNLLYIRHWFMFYSQPIANVQQLVAQLGDGVKAPQLVAQNEKVQQLVAQMGKGQKISIVQQVVGQIPWGHNIQIITRCKDIEEALFYVTETIRHNWSRSVLLHHMDSDLYRSRGKAITNFEYTLPRPQSDLARETLRNPYVLDFLELTEEMQERELEHAIIQHLKNFMLALGKGFAYVGNQYNLNVEGDDFFLDLLFYNCYLHCYVVIELKVGEFKPEYAGKLNFYISTVDAQIKGKEDKPTIGILLCKTPNKTIVEYSLRGINKPLGVADYKTSKILPKELKADLPTVEELQKELEKIEVPQNPIAEKMNRLKALVSSLKNEESKEKRNAANTERIFSKVLLPLKNMLLNELAEISKQFHETDWMIWMDIKGHGTDKSARAYLKEQRGLFGEFKLDILLNGFKPVGTRAFDCWKTVLIRFEDYRYTIAISQHYKEVLIEKLYHQLPSKAELNSVIEKFCLTLLEEIEQRVEQIKSES